MTDHEKRAPVQGYAADETQIRRDVMSTDYGHIVINYPMRLTEADVADFEQRVVLTIRTMRRMVERAATEETTRVLGRAKPASSTLSQDITHDGQ